MKNILFDLDGTLTDPKEGITRSIQHALQELDQPVPKTDDLLWCIGPPLLQSFKTLVGPSQPHLAQKALTLYRERFGRVGKFENQVYQEIPELLAQLKSKGYTLYVATSKPAVFARQIVDYFNLAPYFDNVFGSRLSGELGEKKELIQYILDQKKLRVEETVMVGDRKYDIIGAKACSVATIGVTYGYGSIEELDAAGADAVADHPLAVRDAIGKWQTGRFILTVIIVI